MGGGQEWDELVPAKGWTDVESATEEPTEGPLEALRPVLATVEPLTLPKVGGLGELPWSPPEETQTWGPCSGPKELV